MNKLQKIIFWLFAALLFFVPLVLWPFTSEVFEFNKMLLTYILTTLIAAVWLARMIKEKRFIFRRTILDIPLLIFLGSQVISTLLSIDPLTSWLGYYSRFNGGLLSDICYAVLYWAFASNINLKYAKKLISVFLGSAALVSIYGVLEHFGIDKSIWVQDVQSRVFSTLGQPNWLAAWLVALMPISWALALEKLKTNFKFQILKPRFLIYFSLSLLFFWTMIFTKSRSGYLGMATAFVIFWVLLLWNERKNIKKHIAALLLIGGSFFAVIVISGTEYTPSISSIVNPQHTTLNTQTQVSEGPALETGGTESGKIREIVWKGAIQVWLHYPVFGTGVETFAYSYYKFRPAEHNLVSEWDFIYNKAHNEFLNVAADTGTVGLLSYLVLIGFTAYLLFEQQRSDGNLIALALLAGYVSLSVTNFFGFSVVPTQLEFFLFAAFAVALTMNKEDKMSEAKNTALSGTQKILITLVFLSAGYFILRTVNYWSADTLYAKGMAYNSIDKPDTAIKYLTEAIAKSPDQPLFHDKLSTAYAKIAVALDQQKDTANEKVYMQKAIAESDTAVGLSPANVNLKRTRFGIFIMLSTIDPNYLINARDTLLDAITYAPTDAKLYYNLGLTYARIGQTEEALSTLKKTVELKANYKEARLAYAILLIQEKKNDEAKTQLNYILQNIDPSDSLTKQTLEGIK